MNFRVMSAQLRTRIAHIATCFLAFSLITGVRASCNNDAFDPDGNTCGFTFSGSTAVGLAVAILALIVIAVGGTIMARRRRMRKAQANLALMQLTQQGAQGHSYAPNYQNYEQQYTSSQAYYPPPPGPPSDLKGPVSPPYETADVPQFPPPTYSKA